MTQESEHSKPIPLPTEGRGSVATKLRVWTICVFTVTLSIFTSLGIDEERHERLAIEQGQGQALLAHLAHMPEFQRTREAALAQLAQLEDLLGATGADVELVRDGTGARAGRTILASRQVDLGEGPSTLLYSTDPDRERDATRRSVVTHTIHGILALALLIAGFEWILRRKLVGPLRAMALQVRLMRRGGWSPRLPAADRELQELNRAIAGLGPALEAQVHQWVEAERRIAMAELLRSLRRSLGDLLGRVRQFADELRTQHLVAPDGAKKMQALLVDLERIPRVFEEEEWHRFGPERTRPQESDDRASKGGRP